jgi:hypothetical protein
MSNGVGLGLGGSRRLKSGGEAGRTHQEHRLGGNGPGEAFWCGAEIGTDGGFWGVDNGTDGNLVSE